MYTNITVTYDSGEKGTGFYVDKSNKDNTKAEGVFFSENEKLAQIICSVIAIEEKLEMNLYA